MLRSGPPAAAVAAGLALVAVMSPALQPAAARWRLTASCEAAMATAMAVLALAMVAAGDDASGRRGRVWDGSASASLAR